MYKIPAAQNRTEETVKRSRFIASVAHAPSEEDAKAFISSIKIEFPDASHNCWAYVAGPPGDTARIGMSDDGEPHATAGKPILTVLLHCQVGEIVAVVTRYFGGTKLGTGGLVRAYSSAVKSALAGLAVKAKKDCRPLTVITDYAQITAIKQLVKSFNAKITGEQYEARVCFEVELSTTQVDQFIRAVKDLTGGQGIIRK